MTTGSTVNHTYPRRPLNAHPDFYALWADGHGRELSESRLYFCNRDGDVFRLPPAIADGDGEGTDQQVNAQPLKQEASSPRLPNASFPLTTRYRPDFGLLPTHSRRRPSL